MPLQPPYLGVAYYPEAWPETEIPHDIQRFKEFGVNCVRIGEFAWHRMEPREGEFDFSFFHRVVDRLREHHIAVILGTPTATPPRWLTRKYPDMCVLSQSGLRVDHGGRRHCCSNNADYNRYALRLVEKMAQSFADEENVIGWQIDNEIYTFDMGCFCPACVKEFQASLKAQYHDIDKLNEAWNLNLFSQWYDSFEDIPAPMNGWHNPHLRMAWYAFQNDSHIRFVHRQAEILHRYVHVPVGTDTMPFNGMDYRKLTEKLDVVQFNHYNTPGDLIHCAFWMDYLRTLKDRPFWNTETATCWNGSTSIPQSVKPDGFCTANSWLPLALGGEANLYWLWRTHWAGHELMHGAVLDTSGRPMLAAEEVKQVSRDLHAASSFLSDTKVSSSVALHFSSLNWNMFMQQEIVPGLSYEEMLVNRFYRPLNDLGCRPDVIDAAADLTPYKVVVSPLMLTLEEDALPQRLEQWIRDGGIWIAGPLTDERTAIGSRYTHCLYGMLERLMGIEWKYALPDTEGRTRVSWMDGTPFDCDTWFEVSDPCEAEALAYVAKGHQALLGKAVVLSKRVGKGNVVLLGTLPSPETEKVLLQRIFSQNGVPFQEGNENVLIAPRYKGDRHVGDIVIALSEKAGRFQAPHHARNVCTGEICGGRVELRPYEVLPLSYDLPEEAE